MQASVFLPTLIALLGEAKRGNMGISVGDLNARLGHLRHLAADLIGHIPIDYQ